MLRRIRLRPVDLLQSVLAVLLSGLALGGCAVGESFVRSREETLILGKTTYRDIVAQMGRPVNEGTESRNQRVLRFVRYVSGLPPVKYVSVPFRSQLFVFLGDVLVAHAFTSSFQEDRTNFDETKLNQIVKGQTAEAEVVALLGKPTGRAIHPFLKSEGDRGLVYFYQESDFRGGRYYRKLAVVSLDARGVVTDVDLEVVGSR